MIVAEITTTEPTPPTEPVIPPTIEFEDRSSDLVGFTHVGPVGVPSDGLSGIAVFDYNNDGLLDLFVSNGQGGPDGLLENQGDNTFVNVSASSGISQTPGFGSSGVSAGDLDNDGDEELIVIGESGAFIGPLSTIPIRLYRNDLVETGESGFTDVTDESGLSIPVVPGYGLQVTLGDIDNDSPVSYTHLTLPTTPYV